MAPFRLAAVVLLALLCGCARYRDAASGRLAEAAESEFGSSGYACIDTVEVAKKAGVDYEEAVDGCLVKDRKAMHTLFWLTEHAGFDAASGQGHAAVVGALLRKLGDDFFASCVADEEPQIRKCVARNLIYDMGFEDFRGRELHEFTERCPKTCAAVLPVEERVRIFVEACRREVHRYQPDYDLADLGVAAVPTLLKLLDDHRKVWVRIGPPQGGPESRFIDVDYLFADDERPRSSVAEFALLCLCRIRCGESMEYAHVHAMFRSVLHEFTDYDGAVTRATKDRLRRWWARAGSTGAGN